MQIVVFMSSCAIARSALQVSSLWAPLAMLVCGNMTVLHEFANVLA